MRYSRLVPITLLALPAVLRGQGFDPSPPSFCGERTAASSSGQGADDSRVLIRFAAGISATQEEALFARALGALTADRIRQAVDVDVRARGLNSGGASADAASAVAEGRVLGVRFVLVGVVNSVDDRYVVTYRLVDARSGREMNNGSISQSVLAVDSLVGAMTTTLTRAFGKPAYRPPPQDRVQTASRAALLAYLRALIDADAFDRDRLATADSLLRASIQADPSFTAARFRLAEVSLRQLDWGAAGDSVRTVHVRDGLWNVAHALLRDPFSTRALSLMGRLHLHGGNASLVEPIVAALDRVAPGSADAVTLRAQMLRAQGRDAQALEVIRSRPANTDRSIMALAVRADLERRVGDPVQACRTLNRAVALDPLYAPAYVWRSVVRSTMGERREAWADAEVASRLGRADWGELTGALVDLSVRDTLRAKDRLNAQMRGDALNGAGWLDLVLRAGVAYGLQQPANARKAVALIACRDPRREQLTREPLLRFLKLPSDCAGAARRNRPAIASAGAS